MYKINTLRSCGSFVSARYVRSTFPSERFPGVHNVCGEPFSICGRPARISFQENYRGLLVHFHKCGTTRISLRCLSQLDEAGKLIALSETDYAAELLQLEDEALALR